MDKWLLTFFGYPIFVGMSACYWWHKHVVVHHPAPNVNRGRVMQIFFPGSRVLEKKYFVAREGGASITKSCRDWFFLLPSHLSDSICRRQAGGHLCAACDDPAGQERRMD